MTNTAATVVPEMPVAGVDFIEAGDACVDFYRSAEASVEEESAYMRRLADRIDELGHAQAALVLNDLAIQWEVGVWEGEQDEVWQSGLWAEAGRLLADDGAIRCADLAEWWGIDGYEGEPDPDDMLRRQSQIWQSSRAAEYFVLIVGSRLDETPTQVQARVVDNAVVGSAVVVEGALAVDQLPLSVEHLYADLLTAEASAAAQTQVIRFDLANAVPEVVRVDDLTFRVFVDTEGFPPPVQVLGDIEPSG